jgi:tRNA(Ile)-lysidine synthase
MPNKSGPFVFKIRDTIRKHRMLAPGDRVLVAVSGGPDSVCLLNVLDALSRELEISLHIAYLDHMLRGAESARDARFVADTAEKLRLPATVEAIDVAAYCWERGLSVQAGAREARYAFLARVAAGVGASRIATAHTADDQAETLLLRLLRGAGLSGLSGIPPVRDNIIRPLIAVTKAEVFEYLRSTGIEFVSDPSNANPVYARNRIRMELIPLLKQFNPRIVETLAAEAALLRDEDEAAEGWLAAQADSVVTQEGDRVVLVRGKFNALSKALQRRLLRKAAESAAGGPVEFSFVQAEEILSFLSLAQTGRRMDVPGGLAIEREYERFVITAAGESPGFGCKLLVPGRTEIPEAGILVETAILEPDQAVPPHRTKAVPEENNFWQAQFDYDKINAPLEVRTRRSGDWFCPSGMGGKSKKLHDFFIDAKVPRHRRQRVPLLATPNAILWVVGFRLDERFRPGADTKKVLTVTVRAAEH